MKAFLLDTYTFIWWASTPEKLSEKVLSLCQDRGNRLVLSVVSVWEMQIKMRLKKLSFDGELTQLIEEQKAINGLQILQIELAHVLALSQLANYHKDPFDRLLIAQSNVENLVILSKDAILSKYTANIYW